MQSRRTAFAVLGAISAASFTKAQSRRDGGALSTFTQSITEGTTFRGSLTVTDFLIGPNGLLYATGQLTGLVNGAQVTQSVTALVTGLQATCTILELTLGPLDLNLLGLEIHLDEVHLVITANPAGGILGQLLCALANLLNTGGLLTQIVGLLQKILQALQA
jgi:hypothetical protein